MEDKTKSTEDLQHYLLNNVHGSKNFGSVGPTHQNTTHADLKIKQIAENLEHFVTHFVLEFEFKLHCYQLILEGEKKKAGKFSDNFSGPIGQGIGGALGGFAGFFLSLPGLGATLGAGAGKKIAEKIGTEIGGEQHRLKAIKFKALVESVQKDGAEFRRQLVKYALDIFQSYEMQFMSVTTDQGKEKAMRLLAKDATHRLLSYYAEKENMKNIIEGVVLGKSKVGLIGGFQVDRIGSPETKWSTASLYEKVGLTTGEKYYEKKNTRVKKYGYRRLLQSEDCQNILKDYKALKSPFLETESFFKNYEYILNFTSLNQLEITNILFKKINSIDKNLMEERVMELLIEIKDEITGDFTAAIDKLKEQSLEFVDRKVLKNVEDILKDEYNKQINFFNDIKQRLVESINENRKESLENFEQLGQKQDAYYADNGRKLEAISEMITESQDEHRGHIKELNNRQDSHHKKVYKQIKQNIILVTVIIVSLIIYFITLVWNQHIHHDANMIEHKKTQEVIEMSQLNKKVTEAIWFDVKDPVDQFTGRKKELYDLHRIIHRNSGKSMVTTQMTAISGLGGMGKTQLARQYIKEHSNDFDNNVVWINAESEATLKESFSRLANDKLKIETKDANGKEKDVTSVVEDVYTFFKIRKSLFIFDNVEDINDFYKFLPLRSSTPDSKTPYILITSRNREWDKGIEVLDLNELQLEDAADLVKKKLGIKDESQNREIKAFVQKLQFFPLAIQQAIAYIEDQGLTGSFNISDYLEEYEKKTKGLLNSKIFKGIVNDYEKTTFTTWKITIDKIESEKEHEESKINKIKNFVLRNIPVIKSYHKTKGELALDILNAIAYIAPEHIHREMFLYLAKEDEKKLKSAVRLLVKYSMVNAEEKQRVLSIHRLVQEVVRLELKGQNKEEKVLKEVFELLKQTFPHGSDKIDDRAKRRQQLPHLEAFTSHIYKWIKEKPEDEAKIEKDYLENLLKWMSNGYDDIADSKKQKELLEKVLEIQEKRYGPDHFEVAITLVNLANVYDTLSDPEKQKELVERALAIQQKHYGAQNSQLAIALAKLGSSYYVFRDPKEQKELLERALATQEKQHGSEHFEVAKTLVNLGRVYGALGDPKKQKELLERALPIQEKYYGSEHFLVALTLRNLGIAHGDLGDPNKKHELLKQALAIQEKHFGSENFQVGKTLGNLAVAFGELGDPKKQKELLEMALPILEKYYGSEHFQVAMALGKLGVAFGDLGDPKKKQELSEKALKILGKQFGSQHFLVAINLENLGNAYGELGDPHEQRFLLEKALEMKKNYYGSEHFQVAITLGNLGIAFGNLGDPKKKKSLLEEALAILEKQYGPKHFKVAITLENLANAYGDLGDPNQQNQLLQTVFKIKENYYGSDHFQVAKTLQNLGISYGGLGKFKKKKDLLEKALDIQMTYYGSDHFDLARTIQNLGIAYGDLGYPEKQKELLEKALALQEKHYGPENFEVAKTLRNLGVAHGDLGYFKEQKELLLRALPIQEKHYGSNHFEVAKTLLYLGIAYGDLGDRKNQKEVLERALRIKIKHFG